ncbi:MAG: class I tRNA ligase family protein, partial [Lentisphaeria bacterium]|nr:class I tRNA ligase family protein [Lentisphaeria bacterium]
ELTGQKVDDLHKHFIDKLEIPSPTGKSPLKRIPEVLDCWFESGSMPYAQQHYPFENKDHFEANYPADFIAEGLDQTRGWFYTLVVLGSALFGKSPYKHVIVNGLILAENGQKMSKRLKNYPDPMDVVNKYGADALRLFMLGSQVVHAEDLKFSENGIKDVLRNVMIPMWNAYSFFVTYANVDGYEAKDGVKLPQNLSNALDRWIISSCTQMVEEITYELDNYNLQRAANRFEKFVDDLTNWYIRRSRRRFWKSTDDGDKQEAYATLHYVLIEFCKAAAPFIPFTTEAIYNNLRTADMPESVHCCDYPVANAACRDESLEKQMFLTMTAVKLGRFLRTQHNLKVRQPLSRAVLLAPDAEGAELLAGTLDIIGEELNVKNIEFSDNEDALVTRSAKANFKVMGKKLGKNMKEAAALVEKLDSATIGKILAGEAYDITLADGTVFAMTAEDLLVQRSEKAGLVVATENGVTIALDTALTAELEAEGLAREIVSKVQNLRKETDLEVVDRIKLVVAGDENVIAAANSYADYIKNEVLAVEMTIEAGTGDVELNGHMAALTICKA